MLYTLRSIERSVRRYLPNERSRQRFNRAKQFVEEFERRRGGEDAALRVHARWLRFLCSRTSSQGHIWPQDTDFLLHFATAFGLRADETREFVRLSLVGNLWREWCFFDLMRGPWEPVARVVRVAGWEHFDRSVRDGMGVILLPVHGHFSRLFQPYLRHRGFDFMDLGATQTQLEQKGMLTPAAKRFEHARQMHTAKHLLARGGIVCNLPDSRQNLDNARLVEFFGRRRELAAGFAELALATGAHVVPVALRFSTRWFFILEFGAPFRVPSPRLAHDERVGSLVEQYADFLRDEWRRYPWNIQWTHLRYYCKLPEVDRNTLPADFPLESSAAIAEDDVAFSASLDTGPKAGQIQ